MKTIEFDTSTEKTASCLVYAQDTEKWLLLLRSAYEDSPLTWTLPGGHLENGEDYLTAAIRECSEEAGIDLSGNPSKLIYSVRTDWPSIVHRTFAFKLEKQLKPVLSWESTDYKWCTLDDLPDPLHWSMEFMLSSDKAAERLHKFIKT